MTAFRSRRASRRAHRTLRVTVTEWGVAAWLLLGAPLGRGGAVTSAMVTSTPPAPIFLLPTTNPFGMANVGAFAAPALADVDGDGDLDALVGNSDGEMAFFRNTGSASAPAFDSPSLQPFGLHLVGYGANPHFVDIDGDGDLDAFVGSTYGDSYLFTNTGSATSPAFLDAGLNPFGLANVGTYSSPTFGDLDGDGDLEALIGNAAGDTVLFTNTGSATSPAFATGVTNAFGSANVGSYATPTLVDLDGDGDLDAAIWNGAGDLLFFENTGSAASAAFASPTTNPFGLGDAGSFGVGDLADIDGDGDLDAFVGNAAGDVLLFRNLAPHPLFEDDFETGNTDEWSSTVP